MLWTAIGVALVTAIVLVTVSLARHRPARDYVVLLALLIFGTNARKRRGLSTTIRRSTSSPAPAALSFGTNTVKVLA